MKEIVYCGFPVKLNANLLAMHSDENKISIFLVNIEILLLYQRVLYLDVKNGNELFPVSFCQIGRSQLISNAQYIHGSMHLVKCK